MKRVKSQLADQENMAPSEYQHKRIQVGDQPTQPPKKRKMKDSGSESTLSRLEHLHKAARKEMQGRHDEQISNLEAQWAHRHRVETRQALRPTPQHLPHMHHIKHAAPANGCVGLKGAEGEKERQIKALRERQAREMEALQRTQQVQVDVATEGAGLCVRVCARCSAHHDTETQTLHCQGCAEGRDLCADCRGCVRCAGCKNLVGPNCTSFHCSTCEDPIGSCCKEKSRSCQLDGCTTQACPGCWAAGDWYLCNVCNTYLCSDCVVMNGVSIDMLLSGAEIDAQCRACGEKCTPLTDR